MEGSLATSKTSVLEGGGGGEEEKFVGPGEWGYIRRQQQVSRVQSACFECTPDCLSVMEPWSFSMAGWAAVDGESEAEVRQSAARETRRSRCVGRERESERQGGKGLPR